MAVNGGAGNAISFSEIRDFYAGSNPVSLSDYNRGGDKVPQSFAGSATATSGTATSTVDDFTVTQTPEQSFTGTMADSNIVQRAFVSVPGSSTSAGTPITLSYTVLPSDAQIFISGGGANNIGNDETQSSAGWTSSGVLNLTQQQGAGLVYKGPAYNNQSGFSGALSSSGTSGTIGTGTLTLSTTAGSAGGSLAVWSARRNAVTLYDATFQNNSSTSTYTLTSDSTGTETVYSPGETATVKTDQSSSSWLIAYDNVTGSGFGSGVSAGDIGVTETSAFNGNLLTEANYFGGGGSPGTYSEKMRFNVSGSGLNLNRKFDAGNINGFSQTPVQYTVTAADCAIAVGIGVGPGTGPEEDNPVSCTMTYNINGGTTQSKTVSGVNNLIYDLQFHGPATPNDPSGTFGSVSQTLAAGDVINFLTVSTTAQNLNAVRVRRRAQQFTTVFTNNSGSQSYTLEGGTGKTTGGAAVLAPGATRNVQTTGSSGASWAVHFDTSSGDCNTNIPTTVGSGNPVNMNLFNAPGTPVG